MSARGVCITGRIHAAVPLYAAPSASTDTLEPVESGLKVRSTDLTKAIPPELIEHPFTEPFRRPVDPAADYIPDDFWKIKRSMDFLKVISKLDS
jgi:hypothetical protein